MKYILIDCTNYAHEKLCYLVDESNLTAELVGVAKNSKEVIEICSEQGTSLVKVKNGLLMTEEINKLSVTNYDYGVKAEDI